jgi:CheY-like chemotaxis protein
VNRVALAGRAILVVEDEPLIAVEIAEGLRGAGASVVLAHCLSEALPLADSHDLSAAVLDFGLRDDDARAVCERLNARDIPFVLYTGYAHAHEACRRGLHLPKPASQEELIGAVASLVFSPSPIPAASDHGTTAPGPSLDSGW